jgi:hypothetical protein
MNAVTAADRDVFRQQQVLGPITLMEPHEMALLRPRLEDVLGRPGFAPAPSHEASAGRLSSLLASRNGGSPVPYVECRHLDSRTVYDLCTHPVLLECARSLYGEDLLLWRSTFLEKAAGGPEFRWHQDWGGVFAADEPYGLEPPLLFTFWIAISEATEDNGCLEFIPGLGHVIPGVRASGEARATLLIPESELDTSRAVSMPLRPGQCVVFSDRAVHSSKSNRADLPRLGLSARFTLPAVQVRPHFAGHACVLASGRDTVGLNTLVPPPAHE